MTQSILVRLYTSTLSRAPQYSVLLPEHALLQDDKSITEPPFPVSKWLLHQHWSPFSRPAYWYFQHFDRQRPTDMPVRSCTIKSDNRWCLLDGSW